MPSRAIACLVHDMSQYLQTVNRHGRGRAVCFSVQAGANNGKKNGIKFFAMDSKTEKHRVHPGSIYFTPRKGAPTLRVDLPDEIVSREEDFSTLKEFFESDPAVGFRSDDVLQSFSKGTGSRGVRIQRQWWIFARNDSLVVSYLHLANRSPTLAIWLTDCPAVVLNNFNLSARTVGFPANRSFRAHFVRIDDLPIRDVVADVLSNQMIIWIDL